MPLVTRSIVGGLLFGAWFASGLVHAQDLTPRAYVITPLHSNAVILTFSFYDGAILFDHTIPVRDATGNPKVQVLSYYHALHLFGRSANVTASLPYGFGHFQGEVLATEKEIYRSGLLDATLRFSVNLKGGPAMAAKEFASWRQKTLIGASVKVVAPTGQYDSTRLINLGTNRWAFKPELALSRRWGHWVLDAYAGVWFFTTNPDFLSNLSSSGVNAQSEQPIGAVEAHLSYDVRDRLWVSADLNFWYGGHTNVNGAEEPDTLQTSSRFGVTASVPLRKHQSLKASYSKGAYVRFASDFDNFSLAWQYGWLGWPK